MRTRNMLSLAVLPILASCAPLQAVVATRTPTPPPASATPTPSPTPTVTPTSTPTPTPEWAGADLFDISTWPEQYRNTWNNPAEASTEQHRELHAFLTGLTRTTLQRDVEQNPDFARTVIRRLVDPVQEGVRPIVPTVGPREIDTMSASDMREFFGRLSRNQQRWALCERQIALPEAERQMIPWSAVDKAQIITDRDALVMDYVFLERDPARGEPMGMSGWSERYPWLFDENGGLVYWYGRWGNHSESLEYVRGTYAGWYFPVPLYGRPLSEYVSSPQASVQGMPSLLAEGDLWGGILFPGNITNFAMRQIDTDGAQSFVLWSFGDGVRVEHVPFFGGTVRRPAQYVEDSGPNRSVHTVCRIADPLTRRFVVDREPLTPEILLQNIGRRFTMRNGILVWYINDQAYHVYGFWHEGSVAAMEVTIH